MLCIFTPYFFLILTIMIIIYFYFIFYSDLVMIKTGFYFLVKRSIYSSLHNAVFWFNINTNRPSDKKKCMLCYDYTVWSHFFNYSTQPWSVVNTITLVFVFDEYVHTCMCLCIIMLLPPLLPLPLLLICNVYRDSLGDVNFK